MVNKVSVLSLDKVTFKDGSDEYDQKTEQKNGDKSSDSDEKEVRKKIVKSYTSSTTLHGFKHTSQGHKFRRAFWIVVCICMIIGLIATLYLQTYTLLSYPTITKQITDFRKSLPFPAVTICNLNQWKREFVMSQPDIIPILAAMSPISKQLKMVDLSHPSFSSDEETPFNEEEAHAMMFAASHTLEESLVKCTEDNVLVRCSDIFKTIITDFGVCYTYNSRRNTPNKSEGIKSSIAGNKYGLGVVLNTQQEEYILGENNDAAGFRVVLHDYGQTPIVQDRGFNIGPGTSNYAAVNTMKICFLPSPYKAYENVVCTNTTSKSFTHNNVYSDTYDYSQCLLECQSEYTAEKCGCRGLYDLGTAGYCTPFQYINCSLPHFDSFRRSGAISSCSCPFPCDHVMYEAKLSSAVFPSKAVADVINAALRMNESLSDIRYDYLELRVFYENFIMQSTVQYPEFTFQSVLSTLGGQMGIFLGASLLSLVELLEFVLELCYVRCISWYQRKKTHKEDYHDSKIDLQQEETKSKVYIGQ